MNSKKKQVSSIISGISSYRNNRQEAPKIEKKDIERLREYESKVKNILSFRKYDRLTKPLEEAFMVWCTIPALQVENDKADIVLSALLQKGKIKDYIDKTKSYIRQIDEIDALETSIEMGYYNYIFFIRQFFNDMCQDYMQASKSENSSAVDATVDNVIWFIQSECAGVSMLRDLPKVYDIIIRLKRTMQIGQPKTRDIDKDIGTYTDCVDCIIKAKAKDWEDIENVRQNLLQRIASMKSNISNGQKGYDKMCRIMTNEWFDQFNPEADSCVLKELSKDELINFYSTAIKSLEAELFADME